MIEAGSPGPDFFADALTRFREIQPTLLAPSADPEFRPKKDIDLSAEAVAAVRAAKDISFDGVVTPERLGPILHQLLAPRQQAWSDAAHLAVYLGVDFEIVRQAALWLSRHARAQIRRRALFCWSGAHPRAFVLDLLERALTDRSRAVREWATHQIRTRRLSFMLPRLEEAAALERDVKLAAFMAEAVSLVRDGWYLGPSEEGRRTLLVSCPPVEHLQWIAEDEVRAQGIEAILRAVAQEHAETPYPPPRQQSDPYWAEFGPGLRAYVHMLMRMVDRRDPVPADRARFAARVSGCGASAALQAAAD